MPFRVTVPIVAHSKVALHVASICTWAISSLICLMTMSCCKLKFERHGLSCLSVLSGYSDIIALPLLISSSTIFVAWILWCKNFKAELQTLIFFSSVTKNVQHKHKDRVESFKPELWLLILFLIINLLHQTAMSQ